MSRRQDRLERIVAVEREYRVAEVAMELLEERLQTDPGFLKLHQLGRRDARNLRDNLEATFAIRLSAEFESGLRDAWKNAFKRDTYPPMKDLLAAVTAKRFIPQESLKEADEVRVYRNSLVHEEAAEADYIPIRDVRRRLCRFFSYLPLDW
jgi:hypothetical protein